MSIEHVLSVKLPLAERERRSKLRKWKQRHLTRFLGRQAHNSLSVRDISLPPLVRVGSLAHCDGVSLSSNGGI